MPLSTLLRTSTTTTGLLPPFLNLNLLLSLTLSALLYTAHAHGYLHIPYLLPRKPAPLDNENKIPTPRSIHYHFTRTCTRTCPTTHTHTYTHIEPLENHKTALRLLAEAGMRSITFAGGEPLLYAVLLGQMVGFCKRELGVECVVVVVSRAGLVPESFLREQGGKGKGGLDVLAVGFDGGSGYGHTQDWDWNRGYRHGSRRERMLALERVAGWCRAYGVKLQVNTVVDGRRVGEDMNGWVDRVRPWRWVCFQYLEVREDGDKKDTVRSGFEPVSEEQFDEFCERHKRQMCLVAKPGRSAGDGHLVVDEYLRFLDPTGKKASRSILEVGVERALGSLCWKGVSWDVGLEEEG
ncbi:radical SAM enzyme [Dichotomopilus funicola]|uniref:Radical SAM enzyme n=1 Tax=Dichotomopilus funicola TaxID=1934379 RepID=A0AAN6UUG3_9PEZI|nr:radical SAM enzyme [Dichotomopilus funicola]